MQGKRILVVDDEEFLRESFVEILEFTGATCFMASSADEAICFLKTTDVDMIVTDINMPPGMSGIEMIKHLNSINIVKPVIVVTGYYGNLAEIEKQIGFNNVIKVFEKPFDSDEIGVVISEFFNRTAKSA